jgi:hypothetical protein
MDETPVRVQLRRTKGWRMPLNTVSVARPTKFGNPFRPLPGEPTAECVGQFRRCLHSAKLRGMGWTSWAQRILDGLPDLRGKNLACWCRPEQPCHADVLLELASTEDTRNDAD